jgi:membrane dipeptidase
VHAHPGRCFLAGLEADHPLVALLEGQHTSAALGLAQSAGMSAVSFSTVSDLRVIGPDGIGGFRATRPFRPGEAAADHVRQLNGIRAELEAAGASVARDATDIEAARAEGRTAALLTCEGADFLEDGIELLADAREAGVLSLTLVHYRVNAIGDIQTAPPIHGGLTAFGRDVVAEANRLGVLIDCAHATFDVTVGVLEASAHPVMISHSHLDHGDRHHARLLSDDHARAVTDAGGLIGAWPSGVTSKTLDDFVDETVRLVDLVGVDHVAIGTDLDANYQPVLTRHDQFAIVADGLANRGLTPPEVDSVLGGNALALISRVCG